MIPRGVRLKNPLNIRRTSIEWEGELLNTDKEFETFKTMEHGVRAAAKTLRTYQNLRGCRTLRQIINRWAPPSENDTTAYLDHVAEQLGIEVNALIDLSDDKTLCNLIAAMARHENGRKADGSDWLDAETILRGVGMARSNVVPPQART